MCMITDKSINLLVLHKTLSLFEEFSNIFSDGVYVIAGNQPYYEKKY